MRVNHEFDLTRIVYSPTGQALYETDTRTGRVLVLLTVDTSNPQTVGNVTDITTGNLPDQTVVVRNLWNLSSPNLLALQDTKTTTPSTNTTTTTTLYPLQDMQGNVVALVQAGASGTTGIVVERFVYDSLGHATVLDGTTLAVKAASDFHWDYTYQDARQDPGQNLVQFSGSNYSTVNGTTIQPDYVKAVDGQNPYTLSTYDRVVLTTGPIAIGLVLTAATAGAAAPWIGLALTGAGLSATAAVTVGGVLATSAGAAVGGAFMTGANSYAAGGSGSEIAQDAAFGGLAGAAGGLVGGVVGIAARGLLAGACEYGWLAGRAAGLTIGAAEGGLGGGAYGFVHGGLSTGTMAGALSEGISGLEYGGLIGGAFGAAFEQTCFVTGTEVVVEVEYEDEDGTIRRISAKKWAKLRRRGGVATLPRILRYITKPIETLRPGDYVLARDEHDADGELVLRQVEEVFQRTAYRLQIITLRSSTGIVQTIQATAEHPVYALQQGWVEAGKLQAGDTIAEPNGAISTITAVRTERHPQGIPVYSFRVQDAHTYFVRAEGSQAEPIWVHNSYRMPRAGDVETANGGGFWSGERGNSVWYSFHPDVIEATGGYGVPFDNQLVDFSAYSKFEFEVEGLEGTDADFGKIHKALAGELGFESASEAEAWLVENNLSAHHAGGTRIELVDYDLHYNVRHTGGAYMLRNGL